MTPREFRKPFAHVRYSTTFVLTKEPLLNASAKIQVSRPLVAKEVPAKAPEAIIASLNSALISSPECAPLSLRDMSGARLMGQHHMQLTVMTQPGDGHFQGTVSKVADERFEVQGPIIRMNLYGNSSWCVDSYVLKPICYCL